MPEIPYGGLLSSEGIHDHLWRHGLIYLDAEEVWHGPAKYFTQDARTVVDEDAQFRHQEERVVMIGPTLGSRLLTFILSLPNEFGESVVITGWNSTPADQTRYHRPGGRMRHR